MAEYGGTESRCKESKDEACCLPRLTIGFVVPSISVMGGSVRVMLSVANRLCDRYRMVVVGCDGSVRPFFPVDGRVSLRAFNAGSGRLRSKVRGSVEPLTRIIEEEGIDVVVGVGTYETLMSVVPARRAGVPLVFNDHGALINQWSDRGMRVISFIDAFASSKVVVLTQRSACDYHRLFRIPLRKIKVIPNWVPKELTSRPAVYDCKSKKLLWAGRLSNEKGVDHLFEIAKRVMPSHPDWTWDVYGQESPDVVFHLDDALRKEGLASQVRLMGPVENMYAVYDGYAVVTLTSYREGLPLVLLEGLGRGLPLVSFDVSTGPSEIIKDGENGFLVPCYDVACFADLLDALMSDVDLRVRMAAQSLLRAGEFEEDVILRQWVDLFDSFAR